jgi:hypothetical protein
VLLLLACRKQGYQAVVASPSSDCRSPRRACRDEREREGDGPLSLPPEFRDRSMNTDEEEEVCGGDFKHPLDSLYARSHRGSSLEMEQHDRARDHVIAIDSYVVFLCFFVYVALVKLVKQL